MKNNVPCTLTGILHTFSTCMHARTPTHTHLPTHTFTPSPLTHTHTYPPIPSPHPHSHTHTLTHPYPHPVPTHTHTYPPIPSPRPHSHTHTYTYTQDQRTQPPQVQKRAADPNPPESTFRKLQPADSRYSFRTRDEL